jgi:hypothetical protein
VTRQLIFMQPRRFSSGDGHGEPLKTSWDYIDGLQWNVEVDAPSRVYVRGHVAVQNEGGGSATNAMVAINVWLKGDSVDGFQQTVNIDRTQHYHDFTINGVFDIEAGVNNIAVVAYKRHLGTSKFPLYVKAPQYNGVWLEVVPLSEL